jgi:hypothetical protein
MDRSASEPDRKREGKHFIKKGTLVRRTFFVRAEEGKS